MPGKNTFPLPKTGPVLKRGADFFDFQARFKIFLWVVFYIEHDGAGMYISVPVKRP